MEDFLESFLDGKEQFWMPNDYYSIIIDEMSGIVEETIYQWGDVIPDPESMTMDDPREAAVLTHGYWSYPDFFRVGPDGVVRVWSISYNFRENKIVTRHGVLEGKIQVSDDMSVETNSSGRSIHEQALLEINHRVEVNMRKGYYVGDTLSSFQSAMCGNKWKRGMKLEYPVALQPKLDGLRCIASRDRDGKIRYLSRSNKEYPHLGRIFDGEVEDLLRRIGKPVDLDGELYIHGLPLQTISSTVRSIKIASPHIESLTFCIFTYRGTEDEPYFMRDNCIRKAWNPSYTKIVRTPQRIAHCEDDIIRITHDYVVDGYEGGMIYKPLAPYIQGRTSNLLKVKEVEDDEGLVVGVIEGKGKNKGLAILEVKIKSGTVVPMVPKFSHKQRKLIFDTPSEAIGRYVKYTHFGVTKENIPRFANVDAFCHDKII